MKESQSTLPTHNNSTGLDSTRHVSNPSNFTRKWRKEVVLAVAEFIGTFLFLFFSFAGTQVAKTAGQPNNTAITSPDTHALIYSSLCFGLSLLVNVWVFFRVSGGLFNPSVSRHRKQF